MKTILCLSLSPQAFHPPPPAKAQSTNPNILLCSEAEMLSFFYGSVVRMRSCAISELVHFGHSTSSYKI